MERVTFLALFRQFIGYHRTTQDAFDKRKATTIRIYSNRYVRIASFLYYRGLTDIAAEDFTISLAKEYFRYILEMGYEHNTAVRNTGICSQVLDYGAVNELIRLNPISALKFKKTPPARPPFYTPQQIALWENYQTTSTMLRKAADLFVLQLHTGFDYGDFDEVSRDHLALYKGNKYLIKPRHKNGSEAVIPLSPIAEIILEKYDYKMKILSNPVYNRAIKDVARELGLPDNIKCRTARKLFLMNKINNEMYSLEAASKMAGHKSVKTTETYYISVNIDRVNSEIEKRRA